MSTTQAQDLVFVSVTEATRLLGYKDRRTVYKLIRRGQVKARKVNDGQYRINLASLKAFAGEEV